MTNVAPEQAACNQQIGEHGHPPFHARACTAAAPEPGSPLYERLRVGGLDDIRKNLDSLDWPPIGKSYEPDGRVELHSFWSEP